VNFRTACPQCASVFRLGEDQLDAAQGWVQCGVCGAAFDARASLLMEDGSPLPQPEPEPVETASPMESEALAAPEPAEAAEADVEADAAMTGEAQPAPATETVVVAAVVAADTPQGILQREAPPDLPSIILIDPDAPLPDDFGPMPQFHSIPVYPPPASRGGQAQPALAVTRMASGPPAARVEYAIPAPGTARVPSTPRRLQPWVWGTASVLLLLAVLAQTAYFLRDTLVSQFPQTRPAFEQMCGLLGCSLSLPKNLGQLQIVGSDLQTETRDRLRLTLTLGNRASHAQAWPVLVLTLTDQRNRPLARRSFAPSEYLGDPQRIAEGIPPGSEQPLNLPLTVRDLAPMGFDLKLSY
jgi:predicted Zn finger-like uncharacterized protein